MWIYVQVWISFLMKHLHLNLSIFSLLCVSAQTGPSSCMMYALYTLGSRVQGDVGEEGTIVFAQSNINCCWVVVMTTNLILIKLFFQSVTTIAVCISISKCNPPQTKYGLKRAQMHKFPHFASIYINPSKMNN